MRDHTKIFFIISDSRSGSTFFANLLVTNCSLAVAPETNFLTHTIERYAQTSHSIRKDDLLGILEDDSKFCDWGLDLDIISRALPSDPFSMTAGIEAVINLWIEKNDPEALLFGYKKNVASALPILMHFFPDSKSLWLIRDGRAVYNSKKNSLLSTTGEPFAKTPYEAAKEWVRTNKRMIEMENRFPGAIYRVHYENLIQHPSSTISDVAKFLKVPLSAPPTENKNSYYIPERYGDLHKNVNQKPILKRIQAWRHSLSSKELASYESLAWSDLITFGYKPLTRCNPLRRLLGRIRVAWGNRKKHPIENLDKIIRK